MHEKDEIKNVRDISNPSGKDDLKIFGATDWSRDPFRIFEKAEHGGRAGQ